MFPQFCSILYIKQINYRRVIHFEKDKINKNNQNIKFKNMYFSFHCAIQTVSNNCFY